MNRKRTWSAVGVTAIGIAGFGAMVSGYTPTMILNGATDRTAQAVRPAAAATTAPSSAAGSAPGRSMAEQSTAEQSTAEQSPGMQSPGEPVAAGGSKGGTSGGDRSSAGGSKGGTSTSERSTGQRSTGERSGASRPKPGAHHPEATVRLSTKARVTEAALAAFPRAAILGATPYAGDDWAVTLRLADGRNGTVIVDGHLRVGIFILAPVPAAAPVAPAPAPTHW